MINMTQMKVGGEPMEVDLTSCRSLSDLGKIMEIVFGKVIPQQDEFRFPATEYNIASITLTYFWWLNNTEKARHQAVSRVKSYINQGGQDFDVVLALLFYKALKDDGKKLQFLKLTAINGKYLSPEIIASLSHQRLEETVFTLLGLLFNDKTVEYITYLVYHEGKRGSLLDLHKEINTW